MGTSEVGTRILGIAATCVLVVALAIGCASASAQATAESRNFVVVQTDDLSYALVERLIGHYPEIRRLKEKGVDFSRSYVSNSLCCPSRATFLTGQYSHNTGVMDNNPPDGGVRAFMPVEGEALPVRLKEAGYSTGYIGRYLTGYDGSYSPPGWDWWHGMSLDGGDFVGFSHDGKNIAGEHHVDYMADQAASFIERAQGPFYLQVATLSPHRIYPEMATTYPDRYAGAFPDLKAPKPSSFNESDVSDKPSWVRQLPRLSLGKIDAMDRLYRDQARAMLAVDDLLGTLRSTLGAKGVSDSTYVVFTSDNGYRLGLHRLPEGKWTAYEHDIRVPLYVNGPGVVSGSRQHMVLNNDLAPTVADLAGATLSGADGRSLAPLLRGEEVAWRNAFLVESAPNWKLERPAFKAVRTERFLYVKYDNGERELYDMWRDRLQLQSASGPSKVQSRLKARLEALRGCAGESCLAAERP